jgi:hypothetical protein
MLNEVWNPLTRLGFRAGVLRGLHICVIANKNANVNVMVVGRPAVTCLASKIAPAIKGAALNQQMTFDNREWAIFNPEE